MRCFPWSPHASICSSVVFAGPVVQSARLDMLLHNSPEFLQSSGESFHDHAAPRTLRASDGSNRARRGTVHTLKMQSEPFAHFGWVPVHGLKQCQAILLRALGGSNRSHCGAVHTLKMQSEPSAPFGWVESLSLWRGANSSCGPKIATLKCESCTQNTHLRLRIDHRTF